MKPSSLFANPDRWAVVSADGLYRYALGRRWMRHGRRLCAAMLNPSKADAEVDDPTVRKLDGFAERYGFGSVEVVNMYGLRSTDPDALLLLPIEERVGLDNDRHVATAFARADVVLFAWGGHRAVDAGRVGQFCELARVAGKQPHCLGVTGNGQPRHPLMLAYSTQLVQWAVGAA